MKRFYVMLVVALVAMTSTTTAQQYDENVVSIIESIELLDFKASATANDEKAKLQRGNVYDYPTKNGIYEGYLYTNNPLKDEPLKIEYGSNFLYSMSTKDYNRFYAGYSLPIVTWKDPAGDNASSYPFTQGMHIGYLHASSLSKSIPLFLEYGANFQYLFGRKSYHTDMAGSHMHRWYTNWGALYSLNVPLNVALRLGYHGGEKCVTPYLGVNLRYNVAGSIKHRVRASGYLPGSGSQGAEETDKIDLFDKTENSRYAMGEKAFERFQVGVNFGVGYTYKRLYVGLGCVVDAMKLANAVKESKHSWQESFHIVGSLSVVNISVGVQF